MSRRYENPGARKLERFLQGKNAKAVANVNAHKIVTLQKKVRRLAAGQETKEYGTNSITDTLNTSYLPLNLNAMSAGDGLSQRDGQEIFMKSISMRFAIRRNGTPPTYNNCRIIIYMDKQANEGNPAALSDILQDVTSGSTYQTSHYQHDYSKRYKILMDKAFVLNDQNPQYNFNKRIKINAKATYSDTFAGIAYVATNAVSMLLLSDQAAGANAPLCYNSSRLYFSG